MKTFKGNHRFLREQHTLYLCDAKDSSVDSLVEYLKKEEQKLIKKWSDLGHQNIQIKFEEDTYYDSTTHYYNVYSDETEDETIRRLENEEKELRQKKEQQKKQKEAEKQLYLKLKKKYGDINE